MPRADNFPEFQLGFTCTKATTNPLGVKGCGEAGAIAAPPTVMNAVINALDGQEIQCQLQLKKFGKLAKKIKNQMLKLLKEEIYENI